MDPCHNVLISLKFKGGKGVKKAVKKVASGLVRDAEKSWFAELSDKGKTIGKFFLVACLVTHLCYIYH